MRYSYKTERKKTCLYCRISETKAKTKGKGLIDAVNCDGHRVTVCKKCKKTYGGILGLTRLA